MKKPILTVVVIVSGLVCWLFLAAQKPQPPPPLVTLPDGTSVRILAVTYGTNHVVGSKPARLADRLPMPLQDILHEIFGQRIPSVHRATTPGPELLVWLDHRTNSLGTTPPTAGGCTALLGDGSNFISGEEAGIAGYVTMSTIYPLHFGPFPRRNREIILNIFSHDSKGASHHCGSLFFTNPVFQTYSQWQAEPLPVTKRAGDLEVTVQGFETGHGNNSNIGTSRDGGSAVGYGGHRLEGRNYTAGELKLRPLTNTNEIWQVAGVEVSDATGNSAHNFSMSSIGNAGFSFMPGLWPDEAAWKLKMELKRTEGFRPGEVFVFKNVPLGLLDHTNGIDWMTNFNGITVSLQSICRRAPQTNNSWSPSQLSDVHFTLSSLPGGTQLDLLRMVSDTGITNRSLSWSSSDDVRDYYFIDIPLAARTADFTFVLQRIRTVEFTIKPELPEAKTKK